MFDKDINLIIGSNSLGKTFLLRDIVGCLYNSNIIFLEIDGTNSRFKVEKLKHLFLKVSNIKSNLQSDLMIMDMIDEMVIKNKIDYIIVDDIDFFSSEISKRILNIKTKKILTVTNLTFNNGGFPKEKIKLFSIHRLPGLNQTFVSVDGNVYEISNFIKTINRDEKINKLLDEK
jgi:thymidine kinase